MTDDQFWEMVDNSRQRCGSLTDFSYVRQRRRLRESLRQLPPLEILSFDLFRIGLISLGRSVYEAALADVESLADAPEVDQMPEWYAEQEAMRFVSVATEVYCSITGNAEPPRNPPHPRGLAGQAWRFEDLPTLYPTLWAKYGHRHDML